MIMELNYYLKDKISQSINNSIVCKAQECICPRGQLAIHWLLCTISLTIKINNKY